MQATYEYKVIEFDVKGLFGGKIDVNIVSSTLNQYGRDGWKVVASDCVNETNGKTKQITYTLMREY